MKAMLLGFAAIFVIAFAGDMILDQMGWSAEDQGSSAGSVRLD